MDPREMCYDSKKNLWSFLGKEAQWLEKEIRAWNISQSRVGEGRSQYVSHPRNL